MKWVGGALVTAVTSALVAAPARADECASTCITEAAPAHRHCVISLEVHAIEMCRELELTADGQEAGELHACLEGYRHGVAGLAAEQASAPWYVLGVPGPGQLWYDIPATVGGGYIAACEGIVDRYRQDCQVACSQAG